MGTHRILCAGLSALSLMAGAPAQAQPGSTSAEKIRRLDIMLMVTGLRCRTGDSDFRTDYGRFTTAHLGALNGAAAELRSDMARQFGAAGAERALDRLSVTMANSYGQGHPWLGCAELKQVVAGLADMRGPAVLEAAADQLLAPSGSRAQLAYARR